MAIRKMPLGHKNLGLASAGALPVSAREGTASAAGGNERHRYGNAHAHRIRNALKKAPRDPSTGRRQFQNAIGRGVVPGLSGAASPKSAHPIG